MTVRAISWKNPVNWLQWLKPWIVRVGAGQRRRTISALAAGITNCADEAAALIAGTEPDFLNLTDNLKKLHACAKELGRATDHQVVSLRDTIGETRLTGSDGLAGVLLDGLRSAIAETETELKSLKQICSALTRLVHLGGQIGLTGIFLNTARYSFRVESARTEATRQSFGAFTEELEPLANQVGAVGEAISGQARNAHAELERLVRTIGGDSDQLRNVTSDMGKLLEQTCRKGQELLDSSFTATDQSSERAKNRDRHSEEAVYHVQFGDIMRQKVEHISAALSDIAEHFAAPGAAPEESRAQADRVLAIQYDQIKRIAAEIRSVEHGLEDAFAGLGRETDALTQSLAELGDARIFEELKRRLCELQTLERRGESMREQSRASWKRALDTSREGSRQMDQLREINFRMHLQSLNAIIKTEWLGEEGRTLGVLSAHMHRVFCDSNALVAETAGVLESLSLQTGTAADLAGAEPSAAEPNLTARLENGLQLISRVQDEFKKTVDSAHEMAERQSAHLQQARRSLGFLQTFTVRLQNLGEGIQNLRMEIAPRPGMTADGPGDPFALARHYTMESEREVHRLHSTEETDVPVASSQGSELGDNVEFF